uniref:DUF3511 domain-containing protein n=2 Tax=Araucaria cunninghamii TaxID=56994 RepID=A0A0D6QYW4_ARACU
MGDYRSRSYGGDHGASKGYSYNYNGGGAGQIQPYYGGGQQQQAPGAPSSYAYGQPPAYGDGAGAYGSYKNTGISKSGSSKLWGFNDPEVKRKKRVAGYKVYTVEGKVKGSFRKGFRWLKDKYTDFFYGWW